MYVIVGCGVWFFIISAVENDGLRKRDIAIFHSPNPPSGYVLSFIVLCYLPSAYFILLMHKKPFASGLPLLV